MTNPTGEGERRSAAFPLPHGMNRRQLAVVGGRACAPQQEVARSSRAGPTPEIVAPLRKRTRAGCAFHVLLLLDTRENWCHVHGSAP
jgi:hypothetical protein